MAALGLLIASIAGSGFAQAQGGVGAPGDDTGEGSYAQVRFGDRNLAYGMRGEDVKTLNWLLRSVARTKAVPFKGEFKTPTDQTVRTIQGQAGISSDGVVRRTTRKAIAKRMKVHRATWYGPGLWGNRTACGGRLRVKTIGVAHKTLPCGTKVTFAYRGRFVRAKVIDRGPFRKGYNWDLTKKLAKKLGFLRQGAGALRVAVIPKRG